MKKGIWCFDNRTANEKTETTLNYEFVCGDEEIASTCRVSLGDVDPATGEEIVDRKVFREIRYIQYEQSYHNRYADCVPWTNSEKKERDEMRREIAEEFERDHGYAPDKDSLEWLLKNKWPKKYRVPLDALTSSEYGKTFKEYLLMLEDESAEDELMKAECCLDDFAATLDDRERELFHLLQLKSQGFSIHGMINALADQWGVEQYQVSRMKKRIGMKLMKWLYED